MKKILNIIRIQDKLKNVLIFTPIFFVNSFTFSQFIELCFGFVIFFFITNVIYVINDFSDIKVDKLNKLKEHGFKKDLNFKILIYLVVQ